MFVSPLFRRSIVHEGGAGISARQVLSIEGLWCVGRLWYHLLVNVRPSGPFEKWGTKLRLGEKLLEVIPRNFLKSNIDFLSTTSHAPHTGHTNLTSHPSGQSIFACVLRSILKSNDLLIIHPIFGMHLLHPQHQHCITITSSTWDCGREWKTG
eukprot:scaffold14459_cov200-Alexandrium_tamarense.AAC.8